MKPLSEQDHYEILEIPRDAGDEAVERAYRMAQATYAEDSLAGYSVFGVGDSDAMRERIEIAHRVLSDPEARRAYDARLTTDEAPAPSPAPRYPEADEPAAVDALGPVRAAAPQQARLGIEELEDLDDDDSRGYDGGRLRRARLHRGLELEDIAGVTKINPAYLAFIEEDRYGELPAPVYVRGFVAAYAHCMGLDSRRVAASYMKNYEASTTQSHRGRFLGGR